MSRIRKNVPNSVCFVIANFLTTQHSFLLYKNFSKTVKLFLKSEKTSPYFISLNENGTKFGPITTFNSNELTRSDSLDYYHYILFPDQLKITSQTMEKFHKNFCQSPTKLINF